MAASSDSAGHCMVTDRDKHVEGSSQQLGMHEIQPLWGPTLPWFPEGAESGILEEGDPGSCVLGCRCPEMALPV